MNYIVINAATLRVGGGKSVAINFLKNLFTTNNNEYKYVIFLPFDQDYISMCQKLNDHFTIFFVPKYLHNPLFKSFLEHWVINKCKNYNYDTIFNLGNYALPIKEKYQVVLFHFPYAVYPESLIWEKLPFMDFIRFKAMSYLFKNRLKYANKIICQTEVMEKRLKEIYKFENTVIIPNAVSLDAFEIISSYDERIDNLASNKNLKLLLFSYYYPHKNFEILIPSAKKIKEKKLNINFIITISEQQSLGAKIFLENIKSNNLEDIIINIGPVKMNLVPLLYKSVDGLFLPTLLESFSGTYIEAMYFKKIILTSELDFAKNICKDYAIYFDAMNVDSIMHAISKIDEVNRAQLLNKAYSNVLKYKNWPEISKMFLKEIHER